MAIDVPVVNASRTAASATTHVISTGAVTIPAGNIALVDGMVAGGRVINSVSDSKGNTWTVIAGCNILNTTSHGGGLAWSKLTTALVSGDTISIVFSGAGVFAGHILDLGDGLIASPVDINVEQANTTSTTLTSPTGGTSAQADQLQIGVGFHAGTSGLTPEVLSPVWNHLASNASPTTVRTNRIYYRIVSAVEAQRFRGTLAATQVNTGLFLTLNGAAAGVIVTPDPFAVVWTGFAPAVTVSDHKVITPNKFAVVWTGFAPTVTASDHKIIAPNPFAVAWTGLAPAVTVSDHKVVTPDPFALTWSGFVPTVSVSSDGPVAVTPDPFAVAWTGFAPTVIATDHKTITPGPFTLAWTGFAPGVLISAHQTITPNPFALAWTGFAPDVEVSAPVAGGQPPSAESGLLLPDAVALRKLPRGSARRLMPHA